MLNRSLYTVNVNLSIQVIVKQITYITRGVSKE